MSERQRSANQVDDWARDYLGRRPFGALAHATPAASQNAGTVALSAPGRVPDARAAA